MNFYKNMNGNSGVESYEIGPTFIIVKFQGSARTYKYRESRKSSFCLKK